MERNFILWTRGPSVAHSHCGYRFGLVPAGGIEVSEPKPICLLCGKTECGYRFGLVPAGGIEVSEPKPICLLCGKTECDCTTRSGPFSLTFADGSDGGSFVDVELAISCMRVLRKFVRRPGPVSMFDRYGLPVYVKGLNPETAGTAEPLPTESESASLSQSHNSDAL